MLPGDAANIIERHFSRALIEVMSAVKQWQATGSVGSLQGLGHGKQHRHKDSADAACGWGRAMTLPKFVLGLAIVIAVVTLWSVLDSASWGTVLLRAVLCAVILQVGYFVVVLLMVAREPKPQAAPERKPAEPAVTIDEMKPKGGAH
ncbi:MULTISPECIES: exopolysaccharide production repressor protein [Hyphomicrobiales]|uniref:exopolysaccharide production repressor protein n=1 Tax=Hyphomicrobiales TaxID=356 RepID=UPI0009DADD4F|nr:MULTISPECIES: exopolysaccharide production repressor protein [Phyllobacteriaceae]MCX8572949.1 hypothetical protein [Aminobacter sp. MET-1]